MPNRPRFAMIVTDIAASLKFYISYLGFTATESQPETGMATMLDSDGDPILLVNSSVSDVRSYLDEPRIVFNPGDTLDFSSDDLDARRALLVERGVTDVTVEENAWGDRTLSVKGPDGYTIAFVSIAHHSSDELLALYERGLEDYKSSHKRGWSSHGNKQKMLSSFDPRLFGVVNFPRLFGLNSKLVIAEASKKISNA